MRRRDFFLAVVAGATLALPRATQAQKPPIPVVGFLSSSSPALYAVRLRAFREGLKDAGYVEGQNVQIEYRWAADQNSQLSILAAELVQRGVNVIVAGGGTPTAVAAKAATTVTPIIFELGADPVSMGFVASLDRPGGNLTGLANLNVEVGPKRLELLHELLPSVRVVATLVNPTNPALAGPFLRSLQGAAQKLGLELHVLNASIESDFDKVFAEVTRLNAGALIISPDVFFSSHVDQLAKLAVDHGVPAIYQYRPFVDAGGLLSYGSDEADIYRLVGIYTAKVLKGEKPAELPVQQSTKVELIVNLRTAKALGLSIPPSLLARADEVIE